MRTAAGAGLASSAATLFARDRLRYVLPDFTRVSWVSDGARAIWEPRIARIGSAWSEIEWRSIVSGIRACALTSVSGDRLVEQSGRWAAHGFSAVPLAMSGNSPAGASGSPVRVRAGDPVEYRVAVGALADLTVLKRAIDAGDDETMGRLLGFPACCRASFRTAWVEHGCVDTTWAMAARSDVAADHERSIEIGAGAPFQANILWHSIGVRAVPHLPCSFDCRPTVDLANTLMAVGRELGYAAEMEWIEEILSWPVAWSALHGIADVTTPVLDLSTRTDATAHEFVLRRQGRRVPAEAAAGPGLPRRRWETPGTTDAPVSGRGLDPPIDSFLPLADWYASDNGFSSRLAMDEAHRPIVELAGQSIGANGSVLDLGCGNAALLKKICESRPGVIPFGIEIEAPKLEHARLLQPSFAGHFMAANMFEQIPLDADTFYSLIMLMPGRLLEVDEDAARRLKDWLRGHFEQLLVYGYGDWLTRYDGLEGLSARAGMRLVSLHQSGAAGLARFEA